jgi:rare lipoprotein A
VSRRSSLYVVFVLASVALTLPAFAAASGGGSSLLPADGGAGAGQPAVVAPGKLTVTSTGDGITLVSAASTLLRNQLSFTGTADSSDAGDTVEIERLGHQTRWQWTATAQATIGSDGSFSAAWQTNHIGRFSIRATIVRPLVAAAAANPPTVTITVYRVALATQYGPGFYGQQTACGEKLTRATVGVANRTLKCGTQVAIYYRGRTMVVPVIDRGPYANGADWDLTEAAGSALGIDGTARIGAVSLPQQP